MNLLALDTSGRHISLALHTDKGLVLEHSETVDDTLSIRLPLMLEELINPWVCDLSGLDALGVCVGPGPFTGVRIGLTVIKALVVRLGIPFCAVDSLSALTRPYRGLGRPVAGVMDAKRSECYVALYGEDEPLSYPSLQSYVGLIDMLANTEGDPLVVGLFPPEQLLALKSEGLTVIERSPFLARDILALALRDTNRWSSDPQTLLPLYLREPDAVVNKL